MTALYDPRERLLTGANGSARLSGQKHAILAALIARRGRTIPYESILAAVYGNPDNEPGDAAAVVKVQVCHLRQAMCELGCAATIITAWGFGYRLEGVAA